MDSGAAFSSGCNRKIVQDITEAEVAMQMTTNAGSAVPDEHGEMLRLKHKMWVNNDGMANAACSGDSLDECHTL